ncbi:NADP-dependent oxidoreductase [Saccharopolyspora rosea]|uniref:NADP-dependent oxidoreductase n=1 Tax=Saccharopolyspora rosea TaxID=524884 RepID=A0ABW3FUI6_9PSEU|nr:NADP-dependent oxidoreductase [Saccharopolyspora rosea]
MKAVQITGYGQQAVVAEVGTPTTGPGEVLVRIAGVALNPLDLKIASGGFQGFFPVEFPYVLGTDLSGTITEIGADVTGWQVGDQVIARLDPTRGGAAAEFAVVPAAQLVTAPSSLLLPLASGIGTAAGTAWQALVEVADVRPDQCVLIHGAAGGVGSFAIQFARDLGAHVIATASGKGLDIARQLGAHQVVDYTSTDFTKAVSEVDVVLDTVGGANEPRSLEVLKPGGLLVATPVPPDGERAADRGLRAEFVFHTSNADRLELVASKIDGGTHLLLDRMLPIREAADALSYLARGRAKGKVILVVDGVA